MSPDLYTEKRLGDVFYSINFNVTLPAFPSSSKLQQIRGFIEGNGVWNSFKPDGIQFPGRPYRLPTFTIDPTDFEVEQSENGNASESNDTTSNNASLRLSASTTYRLPDDRNIGTSTLKGTKAPAFHKYALLFEFDVLDGDGKRKIITIKEPVEIASVSSLPPFFCFAIYWQNLLLFGPFRKPYRTERERKREKRH